MSNTYFVSGIGTDVGKTIVSSVLVEAGAADYWKPIQSGLESPTDAQRVQQITVNYGKIWPERFRLQMPASPHHAAADEGLRLSLSHFQLPPTENNLIIEGAGGLLVPINDDKTILDLVKHLELEMILVSQYYLGSINHTLMSCEVLKQNGIPLKGIIFNGVENAESERIILKMTGAKKLGYVPQIEEITPNSIKEIAVQFQSLFDELENN